VTYLLDTNAVIDILGNPESAPGRRLRRLPPSEVAVPSVVMHELYFGAHKSTRARENVALLDALQFITLEFDREDAEAAGEIRAHLSRLGQTIGPYDVLIAGQARARGLILVTHNRREFERVPGLRIEDWWEA
jgi:tRNA(fMet)-specific endonuclease VapC